MTKTTTPTGSNFSPPRERRPSTNTLPSRSVSFPRPKPNAALMTLLAHVNRWVMLKGRFRIEAIDLPTADRERLVRAASHENAAFLVPNHPEFGLDWMLDKEISRLAAPRMAAWAAHEIVAAAPWFWTRNNLVSNRGGADALNYSIDWALDGRVVLLHPEGMVRWTSDTVHPLFAGIAEMAVAAAERAAASRAERPTFIVPIVWKARYTRDVSEAMIADTSYVERSLGLEHGGGVSVAERFRHLQEAVLARQMVHFGFAAELPRSHDYFSRQDAFRCWLVDDLTSRYDVESSESLDQLLYRLGRVVSKDDRARHREAMRLGGFSRACYDTPTLTQEQMHESLKRIRADLVRGGFRNALHNALPKPYGPRVVHMRVPEAVLIDPPADDAARAASVAALLIDLRRSMQTALDAINRDIAPLVDRFGHPNPMHTG
jgi:hypothetical protein